MKRGDGLQGLDRVRVWFRELWSIVKRFNRLKKLRDEWKLRKEIAELEIEDMRKQKERRDIAKGNS